MKSDTVVGRIFSMADLESRLGLSRATITRMVDAGTFPKPLKLGARRIGWRDTTIDEWLSSREGGQDG
jgi:prophage regulatory protein